MMTNVTVLNKHGRKANKQTKPHKQITTTKKPQILTYFKNCDCFKLNTVFRLGDLILFLCHSQGIPPCDAVVKIFFHLLCVISINLSETTWQ